MTGIRIVDELEHPAAVVRERVPLADLPEFFDRSYPAVVAAAAEQGVPLAGEPFALYHGAPGPDGVDVEAGFPVAEPIRAVGSVASGMRPGGRTAVAVHIGPYDRLPDTYELIQKHLTAEGMVPAEDMWEEYTSDPREEPNPENWRTVVHWPIADRTTGYQDQAPGR